MNDSQLKVFLEYTRRFDDISKSFPVSFRTSLSPADEKIQSAKLEADEELQHAILRYFNLCCEEHYLNANMFVTTEIWDLWSQSIKEILKNKLFLSAWQRNREHYEMLPDFVSFMDQITQ